MIRALICIAALAAVSACSRIRGGEADAVADLMPCADMAATPGELNPGACRLEATDQRIRVTFASVVEGGTGGTVTADVLSETGAVVQSMVERDVSEYLPPSVQDIDGDGRGDVLIARESGNVNTAHAVWIYSGARGAFHRVGEVSGVEITRTNDGYIAVPARSGAAAWNVAFYRLDEEALHPLLTVGVEAQGQGSDGVVTRATCTVTDAPGLAELAMRLEDARAKFCIEPAAQVFGP
ncbi:MAG: hypothetical protein AB7O98_08370 [Hyphomonadaceae bacterium]